MPSLLLVVSQQTHALGVVCLTCSNLLKNSSLPRIATAPPASATNRQASTPGVSAQHRLLRSNPALNIQGAQVQLRMGSIKEGAHKSRS